MLKADNLPDCLLPLICVSIPFGTGPYCPRLGRTLGYVAKAFSIVVVAFGLIVVSMLALLAVHRRETLRMYVTDVPLELYTWSTLVSLTVCALTHLVPHRSTFADIMEGIARVDRVLKLDPSLYTQTKRALTVIVIVTPIWYITCLTIAHGYTYAHITWTFMETCLMLTVAQYATLAKLLQQRFELINAHLMKTYNVNNISDNALLSFKKIFPQTENAGYTKRFSEEERLLLLNDLHVSHSSLSELVEDSNSLYGLSNVIIAVQVIVACTRYLYTMLNKVFDTEEYSDPSSSILLLITEISLSAVKVVVPAVICESACVNAKLPVALVENILLQLTEEQERVAKRLKVFAQHVKYKSLSFTACSVVVYERSLMGQVASTVVMYIVILLQFAVSGMPNGGQNLDTSTENFHNYTES